MDHAVLVQSVEAVMSLVVFALMFVVAIIGYSRSVTLRTLWGNAVRDGKLEKLSQDDILRPWLVRIYQRAYTYRNYAHILLSITLVITAQIVYRSIPLDDHAIRASVAAGRLITIIISALTLLRSIFSTQLGLRAEVRALKRLLPNYNITLEDLIALHETDKYFSPKDLPTK